MMAAFKAHATFSFWKGSLVVPEDERQSGAMGQFGRISSIADLPDEQTLAALIRKAMALTDAGIKPARTRSPKPPLPMPDDFRHAIDANAAARATFEAFSPSARRDYVEWVSEAKQAATRARRISQSVAWMAEGKRRHWKYEKC